MTEATVRQGASRPLSWRRELLWLAVAYLGYMVVRFSVPEDMSLATAHADLVLRAEQAMNFAPELALNGAVSGFKVLALACSYAYATLHYIVTPAVLVWLYRTRPDTYRSARAVIVIGTALAMVGYWLMPLAPPRMLTAHGFIDTMAHWSDYGWWGSAASVPGGLADFSNQLAAMPSLHVGWALWSGWYIARLAPWRPLRWAGALYPLLMTVVVMATANHFWLDAAGGVLVIGVGAALAPFARRLPELRRRRQHVPESSDADPPQALAA